MDRSSRINNAAIFPIIVGGAIAAALVVPLWMLTSGLGHSPYAIAATVFAFGFPAFLIVLLIAVVVTKAIARFVAFQWLRWLIIPAASAALGFVLPLAVGFMFPVTGEMGALAGFVGGMVCSGVWELIERRRVVIRDIGDA